MRTIQDLQNFLHKQANVPNHYKIAVSCLIFNDQGQVLLLERGRLARDEPGRLEGIGGEVNVNETDLHDALEREIHEEIGNVKVSMDVLIGVKIMPGSTFPFWVVIDYAGRLIEGQPQIQEKEKIEAINFYDLNSIPNDRLTEYQKKTFENYFNKFGHRPFYSK